jgi:hypothetical protein
MYPSEIGIVAGAKGFVSINKTFTVVSFIGDSLCKVKRNEAPHPALALGIACDFRVVMP